jgi:hypothetical protein
MALSELNAFGEGPFTFFGTQGSPGDVLSDYEAHPQFVELGLLPIADDIFNNRFVLRLASGAVGFVEFSGGAASYRELAPSFSEFLSNISSVGE